jgi:hypothetical protein
MNNFGVGYAENLKNGCNSHGEAIILNPSRRDTTMRCTQCQGQFLKDKRIMQKSVV